MALHFRSQGAWNTAAELPCCSVQTYFDTAAIPGTHQFGTNSQCSLAPKCKGGKEGRLMYKKFIRWILPVLVLLLVATYLVLSAVVSAHAAAPQIPVPNIIWHPH
jgi:hypothetical protein